jgi:cob(I)alamin adenosyltransferase
LTRQKDKKQTMIYGEEKPRKEDPRIKIKDKK